MIPIEKQSKPIAQLKKGNTFYIQGKKMIIESHFLFIDHKTTKEMIIECYNPENEREYQIRYFDDQVETSIEVYELVSDFQYIKREPTSISW
ncbi:MAG: hypothetical protein WC494_03440 [Candidatus Pacearchaeota archaeon]